METTWQDIAVWAIGITVAVVVVRRLWCLVRGRSKCSSCASAHCPLKQEKKNSGR